MAELPDEPAQSLQRPSSQLAGLHRDLQQSIDAMFGPHGQKEVDRFRAIIEELGTVTDELRDHLQSVPGPKQPPYTGP